MTNTPEGPWGESRLGPDPQLAEETLQMLAEETLQMKEHVEEQMAKISGPQGGEDCNCTVVGECCRKLRAIGATGEPQVLCSKCGLPGADDDLLTTLIELRYRVESTFQGLQLSNAARRQYDTLWDVLLARKVLENKLFGVAASKGDAAPSGDHGVTREKLEKIIEDERISWGEYAREGYDPGSKTFAEAKRTREATTALLDQLFSGDHGVTRVAIENALVEPLWAYAVWAPYVSRPDSKLTQRERLLKDSFDSEHAKLLDYLCDLIRTERPSGELPTPEGIEDLKWAIKEYEHENGQKEYSLIDVFSLGKPWVVAFAGPTEDVDLFRELRDAQHSTVTAAYLRGQASVPIVDRKWLELQLDRFFVAEDTPEYLKVQGEILDTVCAPQGEPNG